MSISEVWQFLKSGCNAAEIAAYAGVSLAVAEGMITEAMPVAVPYGLQQ